MEERQDVFDTVMRWPVLRIFYPFFERHRTGLLYLFFGGLTTLVSWGTFYLFCYPLSMDELIANLLSWLAAVLFAFFTNRTWVFSTGGHFAREMLAFFGARLATLGLEELILFLFVTRMGLEAMWIKIAGNLLVLVLNFVLSKFFVFRK